MTLAAVARGLVYPTVMEIGVSAAQATLALTGNQVAHIGRLYIDGRAASKTLSTGTIQYRTANVTFANGGTTLDIGIQGVSSTAGPLAQPDGTYTVKTTLTGGGGGISANAWNTATMNNGTATLNHGDLVAVVFNMTARAGADSVQVTVFNPESQLNPYIPITNVNSAGAWQTTTNVGANRIPNVCIVFDDGTLGWLDYTIPISAVATDTYSTGNNPNERGMAFQTPWDCKTDGLWALSGVTDSNSGFVLNLYSDPFGTPTNIASVSVLATQGGAAAANTWVMEALPTEVSLSANTNYGITCLASGTTATRLFNASLGNSTLRNAISGGTTLRKITRNSSVGSFSSEAAATTIYEIGVRLSEFTVTGGGSAGVRYQNFMRGNLG